MSRAGQLLKGLTALVVTAGLVVGVPAVLIGYVGWPLSTGLPTLDGIRLALRSGIDPQLLINTLAVIVWVTWTQLVVALGFEVGAVIRGRTALRAPVLPGLQTAAARLAATITLVAASLGPLRPDPAFAQPLPIVTSVEPDRHTEAAAPQPTPRPVHPDGAAATTSHSMPQPTYVVRRFDTLWRIAENTLGDGRRWQEIRDLNLGQPTSNGETITPKSDHVPAGTRLLLPADATLGGPVDHVHDLGIDQEAADEVTVEPGDHFWKIAEKTLAEVWGRQPTTDETARYWRQVIDANLDRLLPPYDPNLVYPGQVFELPPIPEPPASRETTQPTGTAAETVAGEVTVERGDHFWELAESTLAEAWGRQPTTEETARYWRQVIDANLDRLLPPHDRNLIYPGQVFELPPIPVGHATTTREKPPQTSQPLSPSDHDHPDSDTVTTTDLEPQSPTSDDSPEAADGDAPSGPVVAPLNTPPTEPQPTSTPLETTAPTPPESATTAPGEDPGHQDDDGSHSLLPTAGKVAGLGVLAAGLIALINRLRRTQIRQRQAGTIPTPPAPSTGGVEATLRAAAAPTATELLDLALRALAHQITSTHTPPPQVVGVRLDSDVLRILLWTPHHQPPPGFEEDDDGRSWTLPTAIDPTQLRLHADGTPAPYPALVTIGHSDNSQLLLDLEHLGALQVTGDPEEVLATCYTMATELAASPLADTLQVVCVGFGHDLAHLERISVVDHLTDVLPLVDEKTAALATQTVTPLEGRLAPWGTDRWDPLIVIDPNPTPPEGAPQLLAAAHQGRAISAVVGYPTGDRWRLHINDATVRVDPLGYTLRRRNLTTTEQTAIADLIAAAKDLEGTPQAIEPSLPLSTIDLKADEPSETAAVESPSPQRRPAAPEEAAPPALEVRILGTLRIDGLTERFPQPKCLELVTYLALHPRGVEADTLMEALWPEQPPNQRRLNILTSRARTTLGHTPDGELYLPHLTDNGLYRLNPTVGCDLDRFTQHVRTANKAQPAEAINHLHAALDLVEGPPFHAAGNDYVWGHTEGIITHAVVAIDNTAHRLAQHALDLNDPEQATWAARKGLVASWACEECYRNLMRAAVSQDNQTALEAIYNELTALVDADQGPDATSLLDPDTIALYEQHRRNRRRHAG